MGGSLTRDNCRGTALHGCTPATVIDKSEGRKTIMFHYLMARDRECDVVFARRRFD